VNAATLIGPGAGITEATDQDTAEEDRLNVDRTFVTLGPGTYTISDWELNVFAHTQGTITPMLLSFVSGSPTTYNTEWIAAAFDPTSNGVQTVGESGTFTLDALTNIYAGFFTEGQGSGIIALDANNSGSEAVSRITITLLQLLLEPTRLSPAFLMVLVEPARLKSP
jgi:hypothetical protein